MCIPPIRIQQLACPRRGSSDYVLQKTVFESKSDVCVLSWTAVDNSWILGSFYLSICARYERFWNFSVSKLCIIDPILEYTISKHP